MFSQRRKRRLLKWNPQRQRYEGITTTGHHGVHVPLAVWNAELDKIRATPEYQSKGTAIKGSNAGGASDRLLTPEYWYHEQKKYHREDVQVFPMP